jgi:hypothetical protein
VFVLNWGQRVSWIDEVTFDGTPLVGRLARMTDRVALAARIMDRFAGLRFNLVHAVGPLRPVLCYFGRFYFRELNLSEPNPPNWISE